MTFTGYRLYAGDGALGSVDFSAPVATAPADADTVTLAAPGGDEPGRRSYVLRAVLDDVESPDIACRLTLDLDGQGRPLPPAPAAPTDFSVAPTSEGTLSVRWRGDDDTVDSFELTLHRHPRPADDAPADLVVAAEGTGWRAAEIDVEPGTSWFLTLRSVSAAGRRSRRVSYGPVTARTALQAGSTVARVTLVS